MSDSVSSRLQDAARCTWELRSMSWMGGGHRSCRRWLSVTPELNSTPRANVVCWSSQHRRIGVTADMTDRINVHLQRRASERREGGHDTRPTFRADSSTNRNRRNVAKAFARRRSVRDSLTCPLEGATINQVAGARVCRTVIMSSKLHSAAAAAAAIG